MAKKLVITFNSNPTFGILSNFCKYDITLDGDSIIYANGLVTGQNKFNNLVSAYDYFLSEGATTLEQTIQNAMTFFTTKWVNSSVTYVRVGNTIEIKVGEFLIIDFDDAFTGSTLSISLEDDFDYLANLRYFIDKGEYRLNIYKKQYTDVPTEVFGTIDINKGSVKTALDTIRGTGLTVNFEANPDLTFDEFAVEPEGTFIAKLFKKGNVEYYFFLKPDGIYQSYVRDRWEISVDFVDGLGVLKDLSFVKPNGLHYTQMMSLFEIIEACLRRTNIILDINISCGVAYIGYAGTRILNDVKTLPNRFIKEDTETIMSCEEVLKSTLDIFSLVITQDKGQWWIYRPCDKIGGGAPYMSFINYTQDTGVIKYWNNVLGSQIDGFNPYHCSGNQKIYIQGAISAYRLNYKYGFLDGFIKNKTLDHDLLLNFPDWTVSDSSVIINDPQDLSGLKMLSGDFTEKQVLIQQVSVLTNDVFQLKIRVQTVGWKAQYKIKVMTTDFTIFLQQNGDWSNTDQRIEFVAGSFNNPTEINYYEFILNTTPFPVDADLYVVICQPRKWNSGPDVEVANCEVTYVDLINTSLYDGKVGEFHTIQRTDAKSSIAKETDVIFNGDSVSELFVGALYKEDGVTLTDLWSRSNVTESKPILRISAEDDMRIQQKPQKQFSGDVYGLVPYINKSTINNISGEFQPIEWNYSIDRNITSVKYIEVFFDEIDTFEYIFTYDYGSVVKPTIVG